MVTFRGRSRVVSLAYAVINKYSADVDEKSDSEIATDLAAEMTELARRLEEKATPKTGKPKLSEMFGHKVGQDK